MYKKFAQHDLGKYFPTLVNVFTKYNEYTHYQEKNTWL